jgi:hypothetical protein
MAVIKRVFLCPRCEEGISSIETTTSCPSCGLPLGKQALEAYTLPYTLSEQHLKYINSEKLIDVLAVMPIDKANNIANDTLIIFENLAGKRTRVEDIRILVKLGIRIGEIAKAYEQFLEAGGKHHPTHFIKTEEQTKQQQQQPIIMQEVQHESQNPVVAFAPPVPPTYGGGGS